MRIKHGRKIYDTDNAKLIDTVMSPTNKPRLIYKKRCGELFVYQKDDFEKESIIIFYNINNLYNCVKNRLFL